MSKSEKIAYFGILTALSLIFSYIEKLIPIPIPLPGVKLGLPNLVIIVALYCMGKKEAFGLSAIRIIIFGVLFGGISGMIYSFAGGLLSLSVMIVAKRLKFFSIVGVSVIGGVLHNIGQLAVAALIVENIKLFYYIPFLIITGEITGLIIGVLSHYILKHLKFVMII